MDAADPAGRASDTLDVELRTCAGAPLATLARFSNRDARPGYVRRTFDLSAYRGQTVKVVFRAREDGTKPTSFVVDDVSLFAR